MKNKDSLIYSFFSFLKRNYQAWFPGFLVSLILFLFCLLENNPFSSTALANLEIVNPKFFASLLADYHWVIAIAYLKILVLYLMIGIFWNLFFYFSLLSLQRLTQYFFSRLKFFFLLFFLTLFFFLFQLAKKIANYPQVFDEHFYLKGSPYFDITCFVTTYFTPSLISGIQNLVILAGLVLIVYMIGQWLWEKRESLKNIFQLMGLFCREQAGWLFSFVGCLAVLAVLFIVFRGSASQKEFPSPNLIIFSSSGLNASDLVHNSENQEVAPFISELMKKGTVFTNIYIPSVEEFPSWTSIMTSRYPFAHGISHNLPSYKNKRQNFRTLGSYLKEKGYHSSFVGDRAGTVFKEADLGFDEVNIPESSVPLLLKQLVLKSQPFLLAFFLNSCGEKIFPHVATLNQFSNPENLSSLIIHEINKSQKRRSPFFITAGVSYTHTPYASPYPFYRKYGNPKYHGKYLYQYPRFTQSEQIMDPEDLKQINALYRGSLQSFDALIQKTADYLREKGLLENTVIVILSPQGEPLGVKSLGKAVVPDSQENYRIPLVFYGPGVEQGKEDGRTASGIDIAPTILDYLGFREKPASFSGQSLLKPVSRELDAYLETGLWYSASDLTERLPYPEINEICKLDSFLPRKVMVQPDYENLIQTAKHRTIFSRGFKLVYLPSKNRVAFQLFDLQKDPAQKEDLAMKNPAKLAEMKKILFGEILKNSGFLIQDEYIIPVFNEPLF